MQKRLRLWQRTVNRGLALAVTLACLGCAGMRPSPAGRRILFDEAHHNVHTASGRYRPFVELAAAEADAVRDWVRNGGALLLITDHYPIGGANQILADRFGVAMSNAWTEDPEHHREIPGEIVFAKADGLIGEHPITNDVERVVTFGGQSLQGPPESASLLRLSPSAIDRFPDGRRISAAGRSQGLALPFGKGRVVVLGEAAMLTSQMEDGRPIGFTVPGYDDRRFTLNVVRWLAR